MSTQGGREPLRAYRRKRNLDLNVPSSVNCNQDEPSAQCGTQGGQANQQGQRVQPVLLSHQGQNLAPAIIDVDALDDDVIESSPRAFAEAKRKRNRRRGDVVPVEEVQPVLLSYQGQNLAPAIIDVDALDDDVIESSPRAFAEAKRKRNRRRGELVLVEDDELASWTAPNYCSRRRMIPQKPIVIINLESSSDSANVAKQPPPPPPPPKEITFNCPICIGPLVEEMSTKCGHIFCKACIKTAIAAQAKCPTCRKRVTVRELIRVFLPAAS